MMNDRWRLDARIRLESDGADDTGVLCDTHRADICTCNRSAWVLVRRLQDGATLSDLVAQLRQEFKIDEVAARHDVLALIGHLQSLGYVHAAE